MRGLEVGGDWYDIVELPDGRIGIVVGDCVGHDLGAATVMGQLRSACRALLLQDASANQALAAMDRFASFVPGGECATVFCGILDPGTGQLTYSSAAHPPGIVVHPDGSVIRLEGGRSLPLAIRQDARRTEAAYVLPPRSTLLLYTDSLVERRGRPITDGMTAAGAAVREGSGALLEDLADQLMTRLAPAGGYEDDVALVLYHQPGPPGDRLPGGIGPACPGKGRAAQLAEQLRHQRQNGRRCPGGGGRSLRDRVRARPPFLARGSDPAPGGLNGTSAAPDGHRHRPVEDRTAGQPRLSWSRHRADACPHAAGDHRAGPAGTTVEVREDHA